MQEKFSLPKMIRESLPRVKDAFFPAAKIGWRVEDCLSRDVLGSLKGSLSTDDGTKGDMINY